MGLGDPVAHVWLSHSGPSKLLDRRASRTSLQRCSLLSQPQCNHGQLDLSMVSGAPIFYACLSHMSSLPFYCSSLMHLFEMWRMTSGRKYTKISHLFGQLIRSETNLQIYEDQRGSVAPPIIPERHGAYRIFITYVTYYEKDSDSRKTYPTNSACT